MLAPSNLGLLPKENGSQPGTWRAPEALINAGLAKTLNAQEIICLERPAYAFRPQAGTRIRNGDSIRAFSLRLAEKVRQVLDEHGFSVVIGGDCSILLGCLYGLRLAGGRGLVHIDGHSDFYQPGNYDTTKLLGSVAGMDLALASGRGEPLLTHWPQVSSPLASDADIIQVGEREAEGSNSTSEDGRIPNSEIAQFTVQSGKPAHGSCFKASTVRTVARLYCEVLAPNLLAGITTDSLLLRDEALPNPGSLPNVSARVAVAHGKSLE